MKKILGLGGVTTDQIGVVDHIPSSDEVIRLQEYRLQQGGMVATALVAAARLGAETEFVGAVGDDQNGRFALQRFAAEGVGTIGVRIVPGSISAFSFILVERLSGKRTIIHEPGVQRNRRLDGPPGDLSALLSGVGYLHLDGFWMDTAVRVAVKAKEEGIPITLDIGQNQRDPKIETLLSLADYVIPSLAFSRTSLRAARVSILRGWGGPSKTNTMRTPWAMMLDVRYSTPLRCEVTRPWESMRGVPSGCRMELRNW